MAESAIGRIPVYRIAAPSGNAIADRMEREPRSLGLVRRRTRELPNLLPLPAGCPCCTGRVALEIALARHVRERRPERIYIEVPDPAHAPQLAAVIARGPLSRYLEDAGEERLDA